MVTFLQFKQLHIYSDFVFTLHQNYTKLSQKDSKLLGTFFSKELPPDSATLGNLVEHFQNHNISTI